MASFPNSTPYPSPNFYLGRPGSIDRIVLHTTEDATTTGSLRTLTDPDRLGRDGEPARVSAHYLVAPNGEVFALVEESDRAWHVRGNNDDTIGIEVVGYTGNPATWTPEVVASLGDLVRYLTNKYQIPLLYQYEADPPDWPPGPPPGIVSHHLLDPGRRTDPGRAFPWSRVAARARGESGSGAPQARAGAPIAIALAVLGLVWWGGRAR